MGRQRVFWVSALSGARDSCIRKKLLIFLEYWGRINVEQTFTVDLLGIKH